MRANMVDAFYFLYKNRRLKPVEIVRRRGGRENDGGSKSKVYCKHINYHNLLYANDKKSRLL
jgi:hypothetical protein